MTINYKLKIEDYVDFKLTNKFRTNRKKRLNRYINSIFLILILYILLTVINKTPMSLIAIFIVTFVFIFFKKSRLAKRLKRKLYINLYRLDTYKYLFQENTLVLENQHIDVRNSLTYATYNTENIEKTSITDVYIVIFFKGNQKLLIPREVFKSDDEENFINLLNEKNTKQTSNQDLCTNNLEISYSISTDELLNFNLKYLTKTHTYIACIFACSLIGLFFMILTLIITDNIYLKVLLPIVLLIIFLFRKNILSSLIISEFNMRQKEKESTITSRQKTLKLSENGITFCSDLGEKYFSFDLIEEISSIDSYIYIKLTQPLYFLIPFKSLDKKNER